MYQYLKNKTIHSKIENSFQSLSKQHKQMDVCSILFMKMRNMQNMEAAK